MKEKKSMAWTGKKAGKKIKDKELRTLEFVTDITIFLTAAVCVLLLTGLVQGSLLFDIALLLGILMHIVLSLELFLKEKSLPAGVTAVTALLLSVCLIFAIF